MTGESGPTLAQLAAQERKLRRSRPQNPRHKVTFGLAAFFIGALVLFRQQWIHVLVIATVSGLTTLLILLVLMPLDPERTFVVVGISSTAFVAAALGRLAATGLVRVADESRSV